MVEGSIGESEERRPHNNRSNNANNMLAQCQLFRERAISQTLVISLGRVVIVRGIVL